VARELRAVWVLVAAVTTLNVLKQRDVVVVPRRPDVTLAREGGT